MLRIETLEEERLLFQILSRDTPKQVKKLIYDAIEEFEENRAI
jgi:hypothetical protein